MVVPHLQLLASGGQGSGPKARLYLGFPAPHSLPGPLHSDSDHLCEFQALHFFGLGFLTSKMGIMSFPSLVWD